MSDSLWPPWTVAHQASLCMGLPRQEYWSGYPFPSILCTDNKKLSKRNFPGGLVTGNLHSNAGDMGLIPGQGTRIPHATEQLSLGTATTKPVHSRAQRREACVLQLKKPLRAATKTQHSQNLKKKKTWLESRLVEQLITHLIT